MKKILYFAAGIVALAGCQKAEIVTDTENSSIKTITCSIAEGTKTSINGLKTTWEAGDKIIVVRDALLAATSSEGDIAKRAWSEYSLASGAGTGLASFDATFINTNQDLTSAIVAIYPGDYGYDSKQWNIYPKDAADYDIQKERFQSCDSYIAVPIKKVQEYVPTIEGKVNLKMPMYATTTTGIGEGKPLTFKPMYGIIRFTISATASVSLEKVELTTNSGSVILSGECYYWKPYYSAVSPKFGGPVSQAQTFFDPEYSVEVIFPASFSIGAGETITVNAIVFPQGNIGTLKVSLFSPGEDVPIKTGTVQNLTVSAGHICDLGNLTVGSH